MSLYPFDLFFDRLDSRGSVRTIPSLVGLLARRTRRHLLGPRDQVPAVAGARPPVDVVIPAAPKDFAVLGRTLESLANLSHPVHEVFVVADRRSEIEELCGRHGCSLVEETSVLGFGAEHIDGVIAGEDRRGWLLQQLIKLAADQLATTERFLVIDADTVLLRPHVFTHRKATAFYQSPEWNPPYLRAFERLFGHRPPGRLSFTAHMMLFECRMLAEMRSEMEERLGRSWHAAFLDAARRGKTISPIAEYELYGNWMLARHPERVFLKSFHNRTLPRSELAPVDVLTERWGRRYDSVSFHSYASPTAPRHRALRVAGRDRDDDGCFALVHVGRAFPDYIFDNLAQIRAFNPRADVHVVMEDRFVRRFSARRQGDPRLLLHPASELLSKPPALGVAADGRFRSGFWRHATARFAYLEALMRALDLRNVVHVENDVLVYFRLGEVLPKLGGEMNVTRDAPDRVVGGIVFVRDHAILDELYRFARETRRPFASDMELLSRFQHALPERVRCLPIAFPGYFAPAEAEERARYASDYEAFDGIFDAACVGQYLGGVDPRNAAGDTRGFVNETSIFRCDKVDGVALVDDERGRRVPVLADGGRTVRVLNLHVHSKDLTRFLST